MPDSDNKISQQLKDDHDRTLRSASPAIKRPASDMGGQEREEHALDVEMGEGLGLTQAAAVVQPDLTQDSIVRQDNGKRLRSEESSDPSIPTESNPRSIGQQAPAELATAPVTPATNGSPSKTADAVSSSSVPSVAFADLPSIDLQVSKITELVKEPLKDEQRGFVVSTKWLRKVQARSSFPPDVKGPGKSSSSDGPIGPIDNSDIAMIIEDSGSLKDEAGEKFVELRPGLSLGEDFEIMPQEAWELIVSWYGLARTSPVITRYAHDTSDGDIPNVIYELNPPVWSFLKVVATHTAQTQREKDLPPVRVSNSRYAQFQTWLKEAKELLHIDTTTKVRVWRILGGLKNTSASGILTPVTSRSASPAPGAELIASAGDKLLLDVNTFAALQLGEHRELLDVKDHTNDPNYNGKATLALHGLGRNDVVVLEEQASKSDDWPSENVRFSIGKSLQAKSKALTPSGRTSPAPGMMTRGRQRKDGRPKGITGLSNLGNTCYMNSALQSIRSVEELTQYFLRGQWKTDLNPSNPLGHGGNIAKAYAELLAQIYNDSTPSSVNPSRFKATIGKYGPNFSGYGQQDSQEFLLFLLDGLQEDLNRILKKPYIEKPDSTDEMVHDQRALKEFADKNWDIYKARNDSVITDLFAGMYKSTVTCPVCDKVSIIFDPFNNLTLQLPVENTWSKEIIVFPLYGSPLRIEVDIDKNASIKDIKDFVAKRLNIKDVDRLIMAESYKNKFFKFFNNTDTIAETNISQNDIICIYELTDVPTNYNPNKKKKTSALSFSYSRDVDDELVSIDSPEADRLLIPVYHRTVKQTTIRSTRTFFGFPSLVVIDRRDAVSYEKIMMKLLWSVKNMTTIDIFEKSDTGSEIEMEDSDTLLVNDDESSSGSNLPKAASVEGEDGLVDVSMRDQSQPPQGSEGSEILQDAGGRTFSTPRDGSDSMFEIRVAATGEGIPTGWNSIEDTKMYPLMTQRLGDDLARRRSTSQTVGENGDASDSDDEVGDVPYKDPQTGNESGSESGASVPAASGNESDSSLPEPSHIIKDTRGMRNRDRKKTYAARDRRKLQAGNTRRAPVQAQRPVKQIRRPLVSADNDVALIRPGDALVLDWDLNAYDSLFGGTAADNTSEEEAMRGVPTWNNIDLFKDLDLVNKRAARTTRKKNGISLEDCLNEFGKTETLSEANAWYCPRCKEHRRARKMFELWKAPDILVMHLKRFSSNRSFRDKLDVRVDYPVEGLDLSSMVRDQEDGKSLIYDLIAVDNHYGGLGGGHYTAFAKNFVDGNWHDYNDSHASKKDESAVVTNAAYLLFYRRRTDGPLGGAVLEKLFAEADSEAAAGSRETSPSGEGQRLGDSSHNGSSSAYQAGPVHRVGDGGLAAIANPTERGPALAGGSHSRVPGTDDGLPSYNEAIHQDEMLLDEEPLDTSPQANWITQSWNFGGDTGLAGHANSDADAMEDTSSTRGEGASPPGHVSDFDEAEDSMLYSEDVEDFNRRNVRESAPAPDIPSVSVAAAADDDDEDDLPVQELHAGADGDMQFRPAGRR